MKLSKFNIYVSVNDNSILMYNTLSLAVLLIDNEMKDKLDHFDENSFSKDELALLLDNGFLDSNDYKQSIKALEEFLESDGTLSLVFITSNKCNFRCIYCYEQHNDASMDWSVYSDVLEVIKQSNLRYLNIHWFGGEPTLEKAHICRFMNMLTDITKEKSIQVFSSMVSNGYMLTPKNFKNYLNAGITRFQVTIDGMAKEHNSKRFLVNGSPTFEVIMNNLRSIKQIDANYSMIIRYNYDNKSFIKDFVDFFSSEFGNDKRYTFDFQGVGDWSSTDQSHGITASLISIEDLIYARKKGLNLLIQKGLEYNLGFVCYANMPNSFVINTSGELLKCTIKLDWPKNIVGKINHSGMSLNDNFKLWTQPQPQPECEDCAVMPHCLSRYCPHRDYRGCRKALEELIKRMLVLNYYEDSLN